MIQGINNLGTSASQSSTSKKNLDQDFDHFMLMLTTQLKFQDPFDAMDTGEFTQQLIGFSSVEQQVNINKNLESLLKINHGVGLSNAATYINKEISVDLSSDSLIKDRLANFGYYLDEDTSATNIEVYNEMGQKILTENIKDQKAGNHSFEWNGKDELSARQPEGIYKIIVSFMDKDGNQLKAATINKGIVKEAKFENNQSLLVVNNQNIPIEKVLSVTFPPLIGDKS